MKTGLTEPHIDKCLTISTEHIRPETGSILDLFSYEENPNYPVVYKKGGYGWWIYVPEHMDEETVRLIPDDLRACMEFARKNGCVWLCLDGSASNIKALPSYVDKWRSV